MEEPSSSDGQPASTQPTSSGPSAPELEGVPPPSQATDTTPSTSAATEKVQPNHLRRASHIIAASGPSIIVAAVATIASYNYAQSLFVEKLSDSPTIEAGFKGGERDPQGGFNETSDCRIDKIRTIATISMDKLVVNATGTFEKRSDKSNAICILHVDCYLTDKLHGVSMHASDESQSQTEVVNNVAGATMFFGSPSCPVEEITKYHPRLISVGVEVYSDAGLDSFDAHPVEIDTVYPFTTVSSFLRPEGANRNYRVIAAMNQDEENSRQLYIFVAAAVFGASIASLFESLFSTVRRLMPRL